MRTDISQKKCVPCESGVPPLEPARVQELLTQLPEWRLGADGKRIEREWRVHDFMTAIEFFRRIADIAEAEDHHPDLHLTNYRDMRVELSTHAAGGLTENDFILAAKIDRLEPPRLKDSKK